LIDLPTVVAFAALLTAFLGALLLWLWSRDRAQVALRSWGIARLTGSLALLAILSRLVIPEWISIIAGNALACLSYAIGWAGARQFEGKRAYPAVILAGPLLCLAASALPLFQGPPGPRVMLLNSILALYAAAAAFEVHRGGRREPLASRPVLVALLAGGALVYAISLPLAIILPLDNQGRGPPTAVWFGLTSALAICFLTGSALVLVALTKERAEIASTAALTRARDAAAEASIQKSRFLATMSHELRTPLNGVLGMAQVLAQDPALPEAQRRQAAMMTAAGMHLRDIVNEVLDLSRIEAGRLELLPRPVPLAAFLEATLALQRPAASPRGVGLALLADPALPVAVLADPMRLRQILLNLLGNAVRFSPSGEEVRLAVERGPAGMLRFAVTDAGPGVPEALRARLFQAYAQGEAAPGSTGLGLAISAELARAMGGDLTHADGPEGRGSRFTLLVPLVEVPVALLEDRAAPAGAFLPPGLRVLVVDDIAGNRAVARALLAEAGHEVTEAEDGAAALALLAEGPLPDVVLMDDCMPGLDGQAAVRQLRSMPGAAARLPVVAVTADALAGRFLDIRAAGMDAVLAKPLSLAGLSSAIAAALQAAAGRAGSPP